MEDIFKWLLISFVFMGAIIFLTNNDGFFMEERTPETIISSDNVGLIGPEDIELHRTINVPDFDTTKLSYDKEYVVGDKVLQNGLLYGSDSLSYYFQVNKNNLQNAELRFQVDSTNQYGDLVIKLNGKTIVEDRLRSGLYEFQLNNLSNENIIEFYSGSSGWKLWAPNSYSLKDIEIHVSEYSQNREYFEFEVYEEEYQNITRAKLLLYFDEIRGELTTKLNGYQIFDGKGKYAEEIQINSQYFVEGKNVMEFIPGNNSEYVGDGLLMIYYGVDQERKFQKTFDVSESKYDTFTHGYIEFDVDSIEQSGKMFVYIVDSDGQEHQIGRESVSTKGYTYMFEKSDIKPGENQVIIQSDGNSVFSVSDMTLDL